MSFLVSRRSRRAGLPPPRAGAYRAVLPALALALACLLPGCGGGPAADSVALSDEEGRFGAEQHPQLLAGFGGAYDGGEAGYVRGVGARVAAAAGLGTQCTFTLVNSDVVNAFAVPGCYVYVTRGLLAVVTSEAELASVLGHELGHVVASHAQREDRRSLWRRLGVIAAHVTGSERLTRLVGQAAQYLGLRYSREQEYRADDLSVGYLRAAGYDVYAAAEMLAALQRQEAFMTATRSRDTARSVPEWTLSHPLTEDRIARARAAATETGLADDALPDQAARYLAEVDGLLYGDDPQQGFVIGRRFAHPVMRIGFEAPAGFALTNSPQAIRLSGPDGISGEFGGSALRGRDLKRYAEMLAGHIVGGARAEVARATATTINRLPAVLLRLRVAASDGVAPLWLAVYDGGDGEVYHFIVVVPPGGETAAGGAAVLALFESFRRLSADEAAALRPRVVRTIKVAPGDTRATLIARVADPAPRALFDLLNGGGGGRPLRTGDTVKIVTYADGRRFPGAAGAASSIQAGA